MNNNENNNLNNNLNNQDAVNNLLNPQGTFEQSVNPANEINNNQFVETPPSNNNYSQPVNDYNQPVNNYYQSVNNYNSNEPILNNKKSNKKIVFIIMALIVIAAVAAGAYFLFGNGGTGIKDNKNAIKEKFNPKKPIKIAKNEKYGYISSEGEQIIDFKYDYASDFYGDYAVVGEDEPRDGYEITKYHIINKKGEIKMSSEILEPEYIEEFDVWIIDNVMYNSNFKPVLDENIMVNHLAGEYFSFEDPIKEQSGIMTFKGKKIFTWEGISINVDISNNYYDTEDLYANVENYDERDIIIDLKNGKILYNVENPDDYAISDGSNGIFYVYEKGEYDPIKWLYFRDGKLAYETSESYEDIDVYDYKNNILELDLGYDDDYDHTYKYYDVKNKKMLDSKPSKPDNDEYDDLDKKLRETLYGYRSYECSGRYGLIKGEEVIIKCGYDDISFLETDLYQYLQLKNKQDLFLVEKENKTILLDVKTGKEIYTFDTNYVYDGNSTFLEARIYEKDGSYYNSKYKYLVYNVLTGKTQTFESDDSISLRSNYIIVTRNGEKVYYNVDFKQIYTEKEETN